MNNNVALVYPYFLTDARDRQLFQPLGIALLGSCLKRLGLDAQQFDCTFEDIWRITATISDFNPSIIGIYVMATLASNALRILGLLRSMLPNSIFVAGGPLPTLYPGEFAKHFDVVFTGEADIGFPRFCRDYVRCGYGRNNYAKKMNMSAYPGIFLSNDHGEVSVPMAWNRERDLPDIPLPDREGGAYKKYQDDWLGTWGHRPATIMTSYGCPFHCDFCSKPVFGNRFRKKSVQAIMTEIADIRRLGYDSLRISDDCFTLDLDHTRKICSGLLESDMDMKWSCLSRVDAMDYRTVRLMKNAGCEKVYLGLESGSDRTLALMNKRATVRDGVEAVNTFREAGVKVAGFFMVGYPGETMREVKKTFKFALGSGLDEISFTVPYPLPGSPLYDRVRSKHPDSDWKFENEMKFFYESELDVATLKQMIDETVRSFEQAKVRSYATDLEEKQGKRTLSPAGHR
jgi:anaerobic magnesium-protoporphyrin IX monomethyl ester cyclase